MAPKVRTNETPTPTPTPSPTQTPTIPIKTGDSGSGDKPSTLVPPASNKTPSRVEDTDVAWQVGGRGDVLNYKPVGAAKNYMTPSAPEYSWVLSQFKTWGAAYTGKRNVRTFWEQMVDEASGSNTTPWQVMQSYISGEGAPPVDGDGTGGPSTSVSIQQFDKDTAATIVDAALLSVFGRKATDAEKNSFFKELNQAAKAGTVTKTTRKGGKTVTTTTQKFDQKGFIDKYTGTVLEGMLAGQEQLDLSGEAGKIQDTLRQYSNDMGVIRSDKDILSDVRRVIKGETTAEDAANEVRKQSVVLYKNFADRLNADPTLTVRDLANPYIKLMADTFETDMNNISLTDATIQGVLSQDKLPAQGEFYKQLRQDARYRNTTTAQREASSFASGLASAMGF